MKIIKLNFYSNSRNVEDSILNNDKIYFSILKGMPTEASTFKVALKLVIIAKLNTKVTTHM